MIPLHYMRCWAAPGCYSLSNNDDVIGGFASRAPDQYAAEGEGTLHGDMQRSTDSAPEEARMPGSCAAGAIPR